METKKHFKLFKAGKKWCVMAVAVVATMIGMTTVANADVTSDASTTVQTAQVVNTSAATSQASASADTDVQSAVATVSSADVQSQTAATSAVTSTEVASAQPAEVASAQPVAEVSTSTVSAHAATPATQKNGWVNENNQWTYYNNGNVQSGRSYSYLPTINGQGHNWYLVDNGVAQSGVQKWAGTYYDFDANTYTKVTNNYVKSQWGDWYLFGNDGKIQTGLQQWKGQTYYFDPTTFTKVTNSDVNVNGVKYHLDNNGVAKVVNNVDAKVNRALSQRGVAYVWGGNTPAGFDCSGLVQWAYGLGANYRTTYQQTTLGAHHYDVYNAPKGALLFFGSDSAPYHVAISLGNGTYVHAPEPGDVVKIGYSKYFKPSYFINM